MPLSFLFSHKEASISSNKDYDLEKNYLFNEVNIFIFKFEKNKTKPIRLLIDYKHLP